MKDSAYILENLTDCALVIVDELGRGTSNVDGISIACAIAESLVQSKAFTLFVTHYAQITSLSSIYPTVKNIHLKTRVDLSAGSGGDIQFLHLVEEGPFELQSGYGIMMAELCGFPQHLITETKRVQKIVKSKYHNLIQFPCCEEDRTLAVANDLLQKLMILKDSALEAGGIRDYLQNLVAKVPSAVIEDILRLSSASGTSCEGDHRLGKESLCAEESKTDTVAFAALSRAQPPDAELMPDPIVPIVPSNDVGNHGLKRKTQEPHFYSID